MAESRARSPRLGKGLSALLTHTVQVKPPVVQEIIASPSQQTVSDLKSVDSEGKNSVANESVVYLLIEQIVPNPDQPRKQFDEITVLCLPLITNP